MQTRALANVHELQTNFVYESLSVEKSSVDKVCLSWNWRWNFGVRLLLSLGRWSSLRCMLPLTALHSPVLVLVTTQRYALLYWRRGGILTGSI